MKLLVLTEYWKVVDSQSGRQSHCVAETFLIALKNLGVSSRLGREFWTCIPSRMDPSVYLHVLLWLSGL